MSAPMPSPSINGICGQSGIRKRPFSISTGAAAVGYATFSVMSNLRRSFSPPLCAARRIDRFFRRRFFRRRFLCRRFFRGGFFGERFFCRAARARLENKTQLARFRLQSQRRLKRSPRFFGDKAGQSRAFAFVQHRRQFGSPQSRAAKSSSETKNRRRGRIRRRCFRTNNARPNRAPSRRIWGTGQAPRAPSIPRAAARRRPFRFFHPNPKNPTQAGFVLPRPVSKPR